MPDEPKPGTDKGFTAEGFKDITGIEPDTVRMGTPPAVVDFGPTLKGRVVRALGKNIGESAATSLEESMDQPFSWAQTGMKGVKAGGGVFVALMGVFGFSRGLGIELWPSQEDPQHAAELIGAITLITGIVHATLNWWKHMHQQGSGAPQALKDMRNGNGQ